MTNKKSTEKRTETHACVLISQQAAVELAMKYCPDDDGAVQCDGDIRELLDELENLPPAQPEQKKGKWMLGFYSQYLEKYYYCSKCGSRKYEEHKPLDYFCSNCGADMRGEQG